MTKMLEVVLFSIVTVTIGFALLGAIAELIERYHDRSREKRKAKRLTLSPKLRG